MTIAAEILESVLDYFNGLYLVTLSVTDDRGVTGTDVLSVFVLNVPPSVAAGPDQTANQGAAVAFSGAFDDPGCGAQLSNCGSASGTRSSVRITPSTMSSM